MKQCISKNIQLLLIEQFNCDMKYAKRPFRFNTEGPINDNQYLLFSDHVAQTTDTIPLHINTWKRVFAKLINKETGRPYQTSSTTRNIIARFLGCDSWEELEAQKDTLKPRPKKVVSEIVFNMKSMPMNIGDIMEVHYGPDREIRMEYQGNKHFNYKVLQTVNTKFECGDLVHVPPFEEGEPLVGWDIMRNDKIIGQYNSAENHLINFKQIIRK